MVQFLLHLSNCCVISLQQPALLLVNSVQQQRMHSCACLDARYKVKPMTLHFKQANIFTVTKSAFKSVLPNLFSTTAHLHGTSRHTTACLSSYCNVIVKIVSL